MEIGFRYDGPLKARQDLKCATCLAKATGECPTHGQARDSSCAHCKAVQGGECQSHWGLDAAAAYYRDVVIDASENPTPEESKKVFDRALEEVKNFVPRPNRDRVTCSIMGGTSSGELALSISIRSI